MSDDTYLASNITPTTNNIFLLSEYEVLGATTNSSSYESMLQKQYESGRLIAAICAAPALVFGKLSLGEHLKMTCYPGFEGILPDYFELSSQGVVVDENVITAKGPGFAVQFGLTILKQLYSAEAAQEVASGMLL